MPPRGRSRRLASCCARRSSTGSRRSSSSTRSTDRTRVPRRCSTRSTICSSISMRAKTRSKFPVLYANAKAGTASLDPAVPGQTLEPLLDAIVDRIPPPQGDPRGGPAGTGGQPRLERLSGSDCDRSDRQRAGGDRRPDRGLEAGWVGGADPCDEAVSVRWVASGGGGHGGRRRHHLSRRDRQHHELARPLRTRTTHGRSRHSTSTSRRSR